MPSLTICLQFPHLLTIALSFWQSHRLGVDSPCFNLYFEDYHDKERGHLYLLFCEFLSVTFVQFSVGLFLLFVILYNFQH